MSALTVFKDAWQNRDKMGDTGHSRELASFLPAALEIQQSPPNPAARWLAWSLLLLVLIAIVWASVGQVNIVASAEGKIIPGSRVKQVQPLEKGVIKAVLVHEGQYVKQGQALLELDATLTQADTHRLESEQHSTRMRLAVNQTLLRILEQSDAKSKHTTMATIDINLDKHTSDQQLYLHKRLMWQQWLQYQSQLQALHSSLNKMQAEQAATREIIKKWRQTLPIIKKRADTLKKLYSKQFASETDYLRAEQERIQQVQDLAVEKQRLKQLQAAEAEIHQQIKLHSAQASRALLAEISEQQRQLATLEEELNKARDREARQVLYSPVAGRVQELSVNTVGGVVLEAQQLMLIVPDEETLEVEVFLANKDIGFVHEDMSAAIKIHTFPFTKYGVIEAQVINVSDDAMVDEQRGLIYSMQLRMAKNTIWVDGKELRLMPGMAVTAEVQTGKRRIIEFFLAPLMRHSEESLRER